MTTTTTDTRNEFDFLKEIQLNITYNGKNICHWFEKESTIIQAIYELCRSFDVSPNHTYLVCDNKVMLESNKITDYIEGTHGHVHFIKLWTPDYEQYEPILHETLHNIVNIQINEITNFESNKEKLLLLKLSDVTMLEFIKDMGTVNKHIELLSFTVMKCFKQLLKDPGLISNLLNMLEKKGYLKNKQVLDIIKSAVNHQNLLTSMKI